MDVDLHTTVNPSVMASSGSTGSISVLLHPLVCFYIRLNTLKKLLLFNIFIHSLIKKCVMNISEHWTRIRAQEGKAQQGITNLLTSLKTC